MNPGMLDRRIRLERQGVGTDALGQPIESWALVVSVRARRLRETGVETVASDRDTEVKRATFRVRARPFATSYQDGDRMVEFARRDHSETVWKIHSVTEVEGTGGEYVDVGVGVFGSH